MIEEEDVVITLTHFGYIKRLPVDTYKSQKRGGKGIAGLVTREEDIVENLIISSSHDYLLIFTNLGKVYKLNVYEIPEARRQAKGTAIVNLIPLGAGETIAATIPVDREWNAKYLILATKNGIIKKTRLDQFENTRKTGLVAISIREDDELIKVDLIDENKEIILVTAEGMSIRFKESDVRSTGRTAMGVKGINLSPNDYVVSMEVVQENTDLLVVSENGFGKRTDVNEYRVQKRGGKGVKTYNVTKKTGYLVGAKVVTEEDEVLLINNDGTIIRLEVGNISKLGRNTRGVILMKTEEGQFIVSIALMLEHEGNNG